jgi:carbon storage regulator
MAMLVLSRKKNESIVINNDITIVVVEIRGDKVRLGVEAPKEVPVHRREVYDAIRRNDVSISDVPVVDKAPSDANGSAGESWSFFCMPRWLEPAEALFSIGIVIDSFT